MASTSTRQGLRGYLQLGGVEVLARLASFIAVVVYGASHTDASFGRFAVALTIWGAFTQISAWGTERSAFLWPTSTSSMEVARLRRVTGALGLAGTVCLLVVVDLGEYVPAAVAGLLWLLVDREYEFRRSHMWVLAGVPRLMGSATLLVLVAAGASGPAAATAMALAQTLASLVTRPYLPEPGDEALAPPLRATTLRREMVWMGSTSVLWPAIYFADQVVLAQSRGYAAVADYAMAYKLLTPLIACFALSQAVFVPRLKSPGGYVAYRRANALIAGLTLVGVSGFAAASALLDSWRVGVLLLGLSPQLVIIAWTDPAARHRAAQGDSRGVSSADLVAFVVAIGLYVTAIPVLGVAGAVGATLASHCAYAMVLRFLPSRSLPSVSDSVSA